MLRQIQTIAGARIGAMAALVLCLGAVFAGVAAAQTPFRPVATVNKGLITAYDVDQRARIIAVLRGGNVPEQVLANEALDQLIDDRLRMEAAEDAGFEVDTDTISEGVGEFASQLGISPEEMLGRLRQAGVTEQAISDLVAGQMLWREVVRQRFLGRIEFGEAEIDAEIALRGDTEGLRLRLQEIGLPYQEDNRGEPATAVLADRLYAELTAGGDFAAAVVQHSRAPSAERGGEVGWVSATDIPPALLRELVGLPEGGIARPQPVQGGITILRVAQRSEPGAASVDDPELRERVRRDLTTRRLELLSQGLIQELRRDAMIELR